MNYRNLLLPLLLGAALLLIWGCDTLAPLIGPDASRADTYTRRISYHRGPCFGRCPVYTLDVYDNGLLVYTGERFTDREGTWQRTIDRGRITALLDSFERSDFKNYPPTFRTQIPDLATADLTYVSDDGEIYVTSYTDYTPPELTALDRSVRRLAELPGYRQVSDSIQRPLFTSSDDPERLTQEIIVQFRPGTVAENWIIDYQRSGLAVKERITPTGDYYVLTFTPISTSIDDMLDVIRTDEAVLSAQRNRTVGPR